MAEQDLNQGYDEIDEKTVDKIKSVVSAQRDQIGRMTADLRDNLEGAAKISQSRLLRWIHPLAPEFYKRQAFDSNQRNFDKKFASMIQKVVKSSPFGKNPEAKVTHVLHLTYVASISLAVRSTQNPNPEVKEALSLTARRTFLKVITVSQQLGFEIEPTLVSQAAANLLNGLNAESALQLKSILTPNFTPPQSG